MVTEKQIIIINMAIRNVKGRERGYYKELVEKVQMRKWKNAYV